MTIQANTPFILKPKSYQLRESTLKSSEEAQARHLPFKSSRKVLTPTKTASLWRSTDHDCSQLETQHTICKVSTRFFFSMFRFSMAHAWECETIRGRTHYNGAQSHCGHCQAAHAALSPTLYDNKLKLVIENVKSIGYQKLSEHDQSYLTQRFALKEEDRTYLSSESEQERLQYIQLIISRLTSEELRGSFINTPLEMERNATFDNPTASNRIDCHLEHHLRPLEDDLAEACRSGEKTPKEALRELQLKYQELLKELEHKLPMDRLHLTSLAECWTGLIKSLEELLGIPISEEEKFQEKFKLYLQVVENYLKAYHLRFNNAHAGVPHLKELQDYLDTHQSYYVLNTLIKAYNRHQNLSKSALFFRSNLSHLKIPADLETHFHLAQVEVKKRELEITTQLSIVGKDFEEIHQLMKMYLGEKTSTGEFATPTKAQLAEHLNKSLFPATPTRSDRKRKDASHRKEAINPLSSSKSPVQKKLFVREENISSNEKADSSSAVPHLDS